MTTSSDLRAAAVTALTGATAAGGNVFSPRTWPTWNGSYPVLFATTPDESGESHGRTSAPHFTVTTTLKVVARVQTVMKPHDAGAADALVQLELIRDEIKAVVINAPNLMPLLQQFAAFRCHMEVTEEGGFHLGELVVEIDLEFYQGPDCFYQDPGIPLAAIGATVVQPSGTAAPTFSISLPQS